MNAAQANQCLAKTAASIRRMQTKVVRLDGNLDEQDIAARKQEAAIGWEFAKQVDKIEAALEATRSNVAIDLWCKQNCGCDISTMRRRKRLHKHWKEYESKRRELGSCGQTGLLFGLSLVGENTSNTVTNKHALPVRSAVRTVFRQSTKTTVERFDWSRCQFLTGDALTELPKLPANSVNTIVTSPPYWPTKRTYGGKGIGFESTLSEYLVNLVVVFQKARGVLRNDGVLWVVIDDAYKDGDLLMIPARLTMAMQDGGWLCRSEIIWNKDAAGRPEPVTDRVTKNHEKVLMFTKQRKYFYDPDPIREPLVQPYSVPRRQKTGLMRRDSDRPDRVWSNPMGRNSGSVWTIMPSSYRGSHGATMPEELARRCVAVSCPENGLVLDPFGGVATTALAALRLGHRAISIDINPAYSKEARRRIELELDGDGGGEYRQMLAAE
jgi:DNA modification methylase